MNHHTSHTYDAWFEFLAGQMDYGILGKNWQKPEFMDKGPLSKTEDAEFEVLDSKLHQPERNKYIIGLDTGNGKDYSISSNWRIKKCHTDSNGNTIIDEAELIDISILG